ncbi:MAG TPA: CHAT domain-containing protein [Phycisphaerales bacterium]|nr:CHAT domain-containing protein [Phycisphaerales bacterium]HMP38219.1 CHAT domain-containing protein [Phycisphaerales bacterium]
MDTVVAQLHAPDPGRGILPVKLIDWNDPAAPPAAPFAEAEVPWPPAPLAPAGGATALGLSDVPAPLRGDEDERGLRSIGNFLRGALEHGPIAQRLRDATTDPRGPGAAQQPPTRLLVDCGSAALRDLPWETLARDHGFVAASRRRILSRIVLPRGAVPAAPIHGPLRVLLAVGSAESDASANNAEAIEKLEEALVAGVGPCVDVHLLRGIDKATLVREIRAFEPHVFHFYGHGEPAGGGHDAALLLESDGGPGGGPEPWSATDIRDAFRDWVPHLAVIAACHSASTAGTGGGWSVIEPFLDLGVHAVLGMNGAVDAATTRELVRRFYTHLIPRSADVGGAALPLAPIDAALAAARSDLMGTIDSRARVHVLMPTLTFQCHPDAALRRDGGADRHAAIVGCRNVHHRREFAGRWEERRKAVCHLTSLLRTSGDGASAAGALRPGTPSVILLRGADKTGKTELVKVLLQLTLASGISTAYVSMREDRSIGWKGVLARLRAALAEAPLLDRARIAESFRAFDLRLAAFDAANAAGSAAPLTLGPTHGHIEDGRGELFELFMAAVRALAESTPLVLVLDQLAGLLDDEWRAEIMPRLVGPAAASAALGRCRLVIVADEREVAPLDLATVVGSVETIKVDLFDPRHSERIVREWLLRGWGSSHAREHGDLHQKIRRAWKPETFNLLRQIIELSEEPGS